MRGLLILAAIGLTTFVGAADSPFRLPALAPVAKAPVDLHSLEGLPPYRTFDTEAVLAFFTKHQSVLSNHDRVDVLSRALLPYEERFVGKPSLWRSGPLHPMLALALKAANGAENEVTMRLRSLRVQAAGYVNSYVGLREAADFEHFIENTNFNTVPILGNVQPKKDQAQQRLATALQRQRLIKILKLKEADRRKAFDRYVRRVFEPPFQVISSISPISLISSIPSEPTTPTKHLGDVIAWLDEHSVPRLEAIPARSPHDADQAKQSRTHSSLEDLHSRYVEEFIGSPSFGIARVGPEDTRHLYNDDNQVSWTTVSSALLSFVDRPAPRAYDQRRGPIKPFGYTIESDRAFDPALLRPLSTDEHVVQSMATLKDRLTHRTRDLTKRESNALKESLSTLEPTIITQDTRIEMVAPILAQVSCLRCHDAEAGEALGAFSYVLEPKKTTETK